ncbi:indole-3-glycerol phosphate synthase TrpC [Aciditerrimonas ferrireducens]|uniref:indole-3-glycerol phosphate synthase TrpC n=1 Tax=Aciditerrimonas ferrireducens TaxID=667306 RepID=UPI002004D24C|nr:indole-3-glycerol phosphate synthase TrpC [Aciditerrimonas ferrireducens]MCK4178147.1 indole-3-glycerol phosphate synthase TrpC [Aciditerrimonas ferrireducens]
MAPTYLDRIVDWHRARAATDRRDPAALQAELADLPPCRGFAAALRARAETGRLAVVAEVKRRSPSKGPLAPDLDPADLARHYEAGGASCLSVLTDHEFFGGSPEDLAAARGAVGLPVLRKDFTLGPLDVLDARRMGADAVLLIAAVLGPRQLGPLVALAEQLGMDALVEVHDERELAWALEAGAALVGVNQRDLVSFAVDPERARRLAAAMPAGLVTVAESGIGGPADAGPLAAAGYHAVLVGESLVRASDPQAAVAALASVPRPVPATQERAGAP